MTDPVKAMQVMSQISARIMEVFTIIQSITNQYLKQFEKQSKEKNTLSKQKAISPPHNKIMQACPPRHVVQQAKQNSFEEGKEKSPEKQNQEQPKGPIMFMSSPKGKDKKQKSSKEKRSSKKAEATETKNVKREQKEKEEGKEEKTVLNKIEVKKPKQPPSAYIRFYNQNKEQIRKQQPNLSSSDLMAVVGKIWKGLPEEHKKPYRQAEQRARQKFEAARIQFELKHPEMRRKGINYNRKKK